MCCFTKKKRKETRGKKRKKNKLEKKKRKKIFDTLNYTGVSRFLCRAFRSSLGRFLHISVVLSFSRRCENSTTTTRAQLPRTQNRAHLLLLLLFIPLFRERERERERTRTRIVSFKAAVFAYYLSWCLLYTRVKLYLLLRYISIT